MIPSDRNFANSVIRLSTRAGSQIIAVVAKISTAQASIRDHPHLWGNSLVYSAILYILSSYVTGMSFIEMSLDIIG